MRRFSWFIYLFLLSLFTLVKTRAQDFPKLHFTIEDGLASNTVYSCYRDSKGFMWLTTDKGVVRYNGVRFDVFNTFDGLPENEIFDAQEDLQGRIWFGGYNAGLCYFKDDKFHTAANTPFLRVGAKGHIVKRINIESDSSITIFYTGGDFVNILNETARFYELKGYSLEDRRGVIAIKKMSAHVFRITGVHKDEVLKFDKTGYKVVASKRNVYPDSCSGRAYRWQSLGVQGQAFLYSKCYIYDQDWNVLHQLPDRFHERFFLTQIYRAKDNWILTTDKGVFVGDSLQLLRGKNVSCVTQDREGNYWFGTLNEGVFVLDRSYFSSGIFDDAYSGAIKYARVINGRLFFIDEKFDVFMLDKVQKKIVRIFEYGTYFDKEPQFSYPTFYISDQYKLYYTSNKRAFTVENLLANKLIIRRRMSDLEAYYSLKKTFLVGDSSLYINAGFAVISTIFKDKPLEPLRYQVFADTIANEKIFGYCQDDKGAIWVSTIGGVFKIVDGKKIYQRQFGKTAFKAFVFLGSHLVGYTHHNNLLFCTHPEGNVIVDTINAENCVWDKLYVVDSTHLYISTNKLDRIVEVSRGNGKDVPLVTIVENFFVPKHGETAAFDSQTGYFFKSGSIISLTTQRLYQRASPPILYFTVVKAAGKVFSAMQPLKLPYNSSRNLIISFSTVSFGGNKVAYQYSFSKNGKDLWIDLKEEQINVVNPGYGEYKVKVRAKTMSSTYSHPEVFDLTILRPFWAEWWFVGIVVCCLGFAIFLIVRQRIAAIVRVRERDHDTQVKFMKSEYKALNALMNPHFIFNTLNNVQSLVNKDDKRAANEYLRIFADLVRQNMHNVSNELIPMEKEIQLVSNYLLLEKLRFKEKLHYAINIDEGVDLSEIMVPPLLIQPLVENSIKHGIYPLESSEGMVVVSIFERNNTLNIEVKDNGVGMSASATPKAEGHISFGLENIRKRIEQLSIILNKQITFDIFESQPDKDGRKWTVAAISMPV